MLTQNKLAQLGAIMDLYQLITGHGEQLIRFQALKGIMVQILIRLYEDTNA